LTIGSGYWVQKNWIAVSFFNLARDEAVGPRLLATFKAPDGKVVQTNQRSASNVARVFGRDQRNQIILALLYFFEF